MQKKSFEYWFKGDVLYRHNKIVLRPKKLVPLIIKAHEEVGHMEESRILDIIKRIFFWSN